MRLLPEDPVKRGRLQLLLLIAAFLLPLAGSGLAYWLDWSTGQTGNYGELIEPRQVPRSTLGTLDGGTLRLDAIRGKWILLQFDAPACDARCERKLYVMRQARKALGRDQSRVERVWILTGEGPPPPRLLGAIEGTYVLRAAETSFAAAFPARTDLRDHVFLIDPRGNLMLRFPPDP
ncbi:MAG TPA: cytochrome C oxidase subunit I, partial [Burkholderiales bacterium]|nr:cytochrome C oxidase subunit I [Burkholderiales bacterium]